MTMLEESRAGSAFAVCASAAAVLGLAAFLLNRATSVEHGSVFAAVRMAPYNAREVLGVSDAASPDEIKRAYRRLALRQHPDRGGSDAAFNELTQAKNVLLLEDHEMPLEPVTHGERMADFWKGLEFLDYKDPFEEPARVMAAEARALGMHKVAEKLEGGLYYSARDYMSDVLPSKARDRAALDAARLAALEDFEARLQLLSLDSHGATHPAYDYMVANLSPRAKEMRGFPTRVAARRTSR